MDRWVELIKLAQKDGWSIECPYGQSSEKKVLLKINDYLESPVKVSSYTLTQLKDAIAKCTLVVASDTGVLHLAKALGVIAVGLFGPTQSSRSGVGVGSIQSHFHCSPCKSRKCSLSNEDAPCMQSIEASFVWKKVKDLQVDSQALETTD